LESVVARLEAVTARLEKVEGKGGGSGSGGAATAAADGEVARFISAYDEQITPKLEEWFGFASQCGDSVKAQAEIVKTAFAAHRSVLVTASKCKKPSPAQFGKVPAVADMSKAMGDAQAKKDNRDKSFNNLAMIAECVQALSWVTVEPAPVPFVKEMVAAGDFYGNKVLMEFKGGKDDNQVNFVKKFKEMITDLAAYVKEFHTTGLTWNAGGTDATGFSDGGAAPAAAPAPAAPKPVAAPAKPGPPGGLFAQLQGDVTSGLKKVTRDMTNKDKQVSSVVAAGAIKSSAAKPADKGAVALKDPVFMLDGTKWLVEYQVDRNDLEIESAQLDKRHTVLVYKCVGKASRTVLRVPDKVNAVSIDGCVKTSVVVNNVMATVDMVNCSGCEIQITGTCPTLNIDKCSGVMVYLSEANVNDIQIVTAKSSEMNVQLPPKSPEDDPQEVPIPEQYLSCVKGGKLVTTCVEHAAG
jgi:adenylyl cyclase-associated protein